MSARTAFDLFETDELRTFWEAHEVKKWVVRLGYYPRGCWVTGTKVTKPTESITVYVAGRDDRQAARAAKTWAHIVHRFPVAKLLVDAIRYLSPEDFQ